MDQHQDGAPVPEGTVGQQMSEVEGGGDGEMWGVAIREAMSAKVCSSSSIEILAQTQRLQRAAL